MTSNEQMVKDILTEHSIAHANLVIHNSDTNDYSVFIPVTRDSNNKQIPSNSKLHDAKNKIKEKNIDINFLLLDSESRDIESGLRATLLHGYDADIRNVFLSMDRNLASVWIEPKNNYDETVEREIQTKAKQYLDLLGVELKFAVKTSNDNLPSTLTLLSRIRKLAPVSLDSLRAELATNNFSIPSDDWLKRKLDLLRRQGRIVRISDGTYCLTLKSLRNLGTSTERSSPDITRMLALARRGS